MPKLVGHPLTDFLQQGSYEGQNISAFVSAYNLPSLIAHLHRLFIIFFVYAEVA